MQLYNVIAESDYRIESGKSCLTWVREERVGHIVAENFDDCIRILKKTVTDESRLQVYKIELVKDVYILNDKKPNRERSK